MASENSTETWTACEPGTLQRLSTQYRRRLSRQQLIKRSVAAAGGVLGGIAVALLLVSPINGPINEPIGWPPRGEPLQPGVVGDAVASRLTCTEVMDQRDAYLLGHVSDAQRERVVAHLGSCRHCEESYRQRAHELHSRHSRVSLRETGEKHCSSLRETDVFPRLPLLFCEIFH